MQNINGSMCFSLKQDREIRRTVALIRNKIPFRTFFFLKKSEEELSGLP